LEKICKQCPFLPSGWKPDLQQHTVKIFKKYLPGYFNPKGEVLSLKSKVANFMTPTQKTGLFMAVTVVTMAAVFLAPPIAQPLSLHHFADDRSLWGIPNFGNVMSNVPFILIGTYGILMVVGAPVSWAIRSIYLVLFAGVIFTGLGSAHYHWNPNNDTLVWDRMPMTIVFMSFLSATLAELVSRPLGTRLLGPLVALGVGSVLWWHYTETLGHGDLRLYFWVQFYPMLAIVLLLWWYYTPTVKAIIPILVWIVVWYVIAKLFEQLDFPIYRLIGISGHSLKHLAAAVSTWYFVILFRAQYLSAANSHHQWPVDATGLLPAEPGIDIRGPGAKRKI
jgi:hypothetical protein